VSRARRILFAGLENFSKRTVAVSVSVIDTSPLQRYRSPQKEIRRISSLRLVKTQNLKLLKWISDAQRASATKPRTLCSRYLIHLWFNRRKCNG
jgi:hypothetical protein